VKVKKRYTVLIVEDEPTIADMQSKKLKEAGFIVDIVHCGKGRPLKGLIIMSLT
jgi:DNA-binding response OmpR family regulator